MNHCDREMIRFALMASVKMHPHKPCYPEQLSGFQRIHFENFRRNKTTGDLEFKQPEICDSKIIIEANPTYGHETLKLSDLSMFVVANKPDHEKYLTQKLRLKL